jgi:hypothetical protein
VVDHLVRAAGEDGSERPAGQHSSRQDLESHSKIVHWSGGEVDLGWLVGCLGAWCRVSGPGGASEVHELVAVGGDGAEADALQQVLRARVGRCGEGNHPREAALVERVVDDGA